MERFKKKSALGALLLKLKDYEAYKNYKYAQRLSRVSPVTVPDIPQKEEYHVKHSGNAGDIIYSLPAVYAIAGEASIHFHLKTGVPGIYGKNPHPLGNVMLNDRMVEMLAPLLVAQRQIVSCTVNHGNTPIDIDLDLIRDHPFPLNRGNIARWYFYIFAVNADLSQPWLSALPDEGCRESIVVARSQRYHAPGIAYNFLQQYPDVRFVGTEAEYQEMRVMVPRLKYLPVRDFLELARIIAGSRLFIGNQSFPFSIAEGLKVKRLLEVYHLCPNVNVEGPNGYDFCYQPQLEKLVRRLYEG
jgi:hypothetical protein